jgi:hypothetical protein
MLTNNDTLALANKVRYYLTQGYQPWGNAFTNDYNHGSDTLYHQAMVKHGEVTP